VEDTTPYNLDPKDKKQKGPNDEECECGDECECGHGHPHHGPHHGHEHGPGHGPKHELPPHLMREIMDMKEKIGKLEGMIEVILKKLD